MSDNAPLDVSIAHLAPVRVAYVECRPGAEAGDFGRVIRESFRRLQDWVRNRGHNPFSLYTVGVIRTQDGQMTSYECCVQAPEDIQAGSDGVRIQTLEGGRYAVLKIEKDPTIIGDSIGRFYQEYVPEHGLALDGARPAYEVYYERTMEYCAALAA